MLDAYHYGRNQHDTETLLKCIVGNKFKLVMYTITDHSECVIS